MPFAEYPLRYRNAHSQELIDLSVGDARLDPPAQLGLVGKGQKMRAAPLMESYGSGFCSDHNTGKTPRLYSTTQSFQYRIPAKT